MHEHTYVDSLMIRTKEWASISLISFMQAGGSDVNKLMCLQENKFDSVYL